MQEVNRALLFGENVGYQCGGAEKSTFALLNHMQNLELDVLFVSDEKLDKRFTRLPYSNTRSIRFFKSSKFAYIQYFINWMDRKTILSELKDSRLLLTQGVPASIAINAFKGKTVYIMTDESALNQTRCYEWKMWRKILWWLRYTLQFPFFCFFCRENKKAIKQANVIIANSNYVARKVKQKFGRESIVISPVIDFEKYTQVKMPRFSDRRYIVLFGEYAFKGVNLFKAIARRMPDHKFMIVGRERNEANTGNLIFRKYGDDPLRIYQETKMLLMPSLWEEAFGMAAVEACLLTIPVLVSARGGLPETVPAEYVIEDYLNIEAWIDGINKIVSHPSQHLETARKHAWKHDATIQRQKLVALLEGVMELK